MSVSVFVSASVCVSVSVSVSVCGHTHTHTHTHTGYHGDARVRRSSISDEQWRVQGFSEQGQEEAYHHTSSVA